MQSQSVALHNTVETTICLNAKTEALQSHIQSQSLISPKTPPQTYQNLKLTHLKTTPNKRPLEKEELQQYSQDISIICAFTMTKGKLIKEIGEKLVEELSSVRTINPPIWTPALDKYIDNILNKSKNDFKRAVLDNPDTGDELFKLYCEKVLLDLYVVINICLSIIKGILTVAFHLQKSYHLFDIQSTMPRNIGERKYIIYLVSSLYKFYETTFMYLCFDWIESHARSAKMVKSSKCSGIVQGYLDGLDVWHMEIAGPSDNATDDHIVNDTRKSLRTDLLNLIMILWNHLDCDVNTATKIKYFRQSKPG